MGTTAEKLTYLNDTKQLLKENINNLGGNLTTEPFRQYASVLEGIYERLPKVSGIGASLSLSPSLMGKIKLNEIQGNTLQNGTPTPSSPVFIQNVTGLQNVNVCGKNLFDENYENISSTLIYKPFYVGNGTFTLSTTAPLNTSNNANLFFLSGNVSTGASTSSNGVYINNSRQVQSVNGYVTIAYRNLQSVDPTDYNTQLEKGSTATTYEAYSGNTYEVNLGDIELNKIGDYQDRIYKDNGKWYVEKQIGKVVLDGSESGWSYNVVNQVFIVPDLVNYLRSGFVPYSNYYQGQSVTLYNQVENNHIAFLQSTTQSRLLIKDLNYTGVDAFKTWLSTHNTEVLYVLATPTYTEITNTELIEDLENLYNAKSKSGTTNISTESENLPVILSVSALKGE